MGTAVSRMLAHGPTMRSLGGFSRGPDEPAPVEMRAPNVRLLDYREGGTFCVADPARLMLWRPHMESDQLLRIEQGGKAETVAFVVGANFRKWPTETIPVQYGVDYLLSCDGPAALVTVRLAGLEAMSAADDGGDERTMAKGATPQID